MNRQKQRKNNLDSTTYREMEKDYYDTEFSNLENYSESRREKDCCDEKDAQSYDDCKKTTHKTNR